MTIQALLDLKGKMNEVNDTYLIRFTVTNKDLSDEDFQEKFEKDQTDRLEAVLREEKRKQILLGDVSQLSDKEFDEMVQARNARIIQLQGVGADAQTSNANATAQ